MFLLGFAEEVPGIQLPPCILGSLVNTLVLVGDMCSVLAVLNSLGIRPQTVSYVRG